MTIRPRALWFVAFGLFAALAVPITISFDGLLYVQSSQTIFTDQAFEGYQWTRGPLYPLIIRAVRLAGGTGSVWLVATQAAAAALAAWVVARAVVGRGWAYWVALGLILLNPLTLGYAGSVLQQTWITLVLALNAGLIWAALSGRARWPQLAAGWAAITVVSTFLIAQLAYVCAVSAAVGVGAFLWRRERLSVGDEPWPLRMRAAGLARSLVAAVVVLAAVVGLSRLVMTPWESYERSVLQGAGWNSLGIPTSIPEPSLADTVRGIPGRITDISQTASVILDVPLPGATSTWGGDENEFFGFQPFSPERRCGIVQYNDVIQVASNVTAALVTATCVSKGIQMAIHELVPLGRELHRAASAAFVLAILVLPWFGRGRRALLVLVPFYAYWAMYAIYGASLDRYGFPLYSGSAALIALFAALLVALAGRIWRYSARRGASPMATGEA